MHKIYIVLRSSLSLSSEAEHKKTTSDLVKACFTSFCNSSHSLSLSSLSF